ncbi:DUF2079 domain-containing protein [Fervidibacter sacchari]|uniref:Membrane protein n=1 Tax=Candidatus Fervidibacter sacchari TaxID=1448929 RepID=A0ABT2EW54_9BACT|nr:DUF2079 domain-containing protein [Candidatus Fervidibacter sacchari]MCS3921148.1 putative membrane protein [Candidatus Fervidibacter sacchari]WKU16505.1 DUF2079 domain-containing protein [Candidatus Fervidibacter sacchari]
MTHGLKLKWWIDGKRQQMLLFGWTIVWASAMLLISLRRFNFFGAQAFDLGIFQQGAWLLANGYTPFVTVRGWHLFADHFSPILFVFVPFYKFFPHPFWLFFGQTIALALGVIPLYRLALRHTQNELTATVIAIGYLLHPAIMTMLFFDFHPVLLSVPFVLWAIDALDENRPLPFFIACFLALLCREDVTVSVACLGLYGLLVLRRRWSGAMVLLSVFWFVFATKMMAVLSGEEKTAYLSLYSKWGETPLQIVFGILTNPVEALKALFFCEGHFTEPGAYPMLLLAPFAFFPIFSGIFVLFALPNYAVLALSDWRAMRELGFQHAAIIAPWLAASLPFAFRKLQRLVDEIWQVKWQKVLVSTFALCLTVSFIRYVPHTYLHFHANILPKEQAKQIRAFLSEVIPKDASVSAPSQFVPHLAHRREIYLFPNPFQRAGYGPSAETLKQLDGRLWVKPLKVKVMHRRMKEKRVDYIVLKAGRQNTWPLKPDYYEQTAIAVLTCRSYGVLAVKGDMVVLKRGANFELGLLKLGVSTWRLVSERGQEKALEEAVKEAWERLREGSEWESDSHFGMVP